MSLSNAALHHLGIVVTDLEAATNYYEQNLGMALLSVSPWTTIEGQPLGLDAHDVKLRWAFMQLGDSVIEIHQFDGASQATPRTTDQPGVGHIALRVTDIHFAHTTLTHAGMTFFSEPMLLDIPGQKGDWWVYGKDPFGVTIELYQQSERKDYS